MRRVLLGVLLGASLAAPVPVAAQAPSPTSRWRPFEIQKHPQAANAFLAGPASGGASIPTFRGIVAADLPAGDPLAQYFLLAGRSGGQTAIGGTGASDVLTLQSTSNSTRGTINVVDPLLLYTSNATISGVGQTVYGINTNAAFTISGLTAGFTMVGLSGTITDTGAALPVLFSNTALFDRTTTTNAANFSGVTAFLNQPTIRANGVALTAGTANGFNDNPTFSIANAGTLSGATYNAIQSSLTAGASATVDTRRGFLFNDASGVGSVTNQIVVDVGTMAKGSSLNAVIRSGVVSGANNFFLDDTGGAQMATKGKFTKYNNVTADTSHSGVPLTAWHDTQTGQTANIAAHDFTVAISSATAGRYRMCCYEAVTTAATTSSLLPDCNLLCTDPTDSVAKTVAVADSVAASSVGNGNTTATSLSGCGECDAKAATTIKYSTTNYTSVGVTSMAYKVYVTLEAM